MAAKYTIRIQGIADLTHTEKSKDDVIALLMHEFNASTGTGIRVEWPDGSYIEEAGWD